MIKYQFLLLAELYNLYNETWSKHLRNEVRHELRENGYTIEVTGDDINKTQAVLSRPCNVDIDTISLEISREIVSLIPNYEKNCKLKGQIQCIINERLKKFYI